MHLKLTIDVRFIFF